MEMFPRPLAEGVEKRENGGWGDGEMGQWGWWSQ